MPYESAYERFQVRGPNGRPRTVQFEKAGFLGSGNQSEIYFFRVDQEPIIVGVSGTALAEWQQARRYLSREEKVDVAGLWLKRRLEAGEDLTPSSLYVQAVELGELVQALGLAGVKVQ